MRTRTRCQAKATLVQLQEVRSYFLAAARWFSGEPAVLDLILALNRTVVSDSAFFEFCAILRFSTFMARIFPFQPYRYTLKAGSLSDVVTQPYDKISPIMQARYQAQSPYNLVRIILGERRPSDSDTDNVYTRAAGYLHDWI